MDKVKEKNENIFISFTKLLMTQIKLLSPYNNMTNEALSEVEKEIYEMVKGSTLKDGRLYVDTIHKLNQSDLELGLGGDLETKLPKRKYTFFWTVNHIDIYVPIRLKILYEINKTNKAINELKEIIFIRDNAIKLKENLVIAIKYMEKIEELYIGKPDEQDELLNILRVNDGYKEERELAKKSYERVLEHTQKILDDLKGRYDSKRKDIMQKGIETISNFLKERKVRNHRVEAKNLMYYNGVDVPDSY